MNAGLTAEAKSTDARFAPAPGELAGSLTWSSEGRNAPGPGLRLHAIIVGYGRTGRSVARVLESRGFAWVALDGDYHVAREARSSGAGVIYGDAGTPSVLDQAGVADAHAVVLCIPDALATRQAVTYAVGRSR